MGLFKKRYQPKHLKKSNIPTTPQYPPMPVEEIPAPKEQPLDFKWQDKMIDEEMARREAKSHG